MLGIVGVKLLRNVEMKRWQMLAQNADKCWNKKHLGNLMDSLEVAIIIPRISQKSMHTNWKSMRTKTQKVCTLFWPFVCTLF